jgi:hypothetical protein
MPLQKKKFCLPRRFSKAINLKRIIRGTWCYIANFWRPFSSRPCPPSASKEFAAKVWVVVGFTETTFGWDLYLMVGHPISGVLSEHTGVIHPGLLLPYSP